jgi:DNA gyrase subunit A
MKVSDGNEVVAFTRAEHDSSAETAEVEQISDEEAAAQNEEPDEIMPEVETEDEE